MDKPQVDMESKLPEDLEKAPARGLKRALSSRQVQMIAIGGTIGTGLFLGTGKSLAMAGPASMLIAYAIVGASVYLTMLALGEMSTLYPIAGSFNVYATRFWDPAIGFALQWNYWFNDAVSVASDLTAAQLILAYWTDFPSWIVSLIFLAFLLAVNLIHVRAYGELEYWLSLLKVLTIIMFIIVGIVTNCGVNPEHTYRGFDYWHLPGAPFVNGIGGFASVFVTAAFAYGGTESITITSGELKTPSQTPKIIRSFFWRIMLFYILSILIVGINVPYTTPGLNDKNAKTSPFTLVFQDAGWSVAASFMNAVVLTSVLSAGNHALYAGTRLLQSLAEQGQAPKFFERTMPNGIPLYSTLATSVISLLCFGSSFIGAGQLWTWLQNIVGVSNQISWIIIGITSYRFGRGWRLQGRSPSDLPFNAKIWPVGPLVVAGFNIFIVLIQGWSSFKGGFQAIDFVSYYVEIPVFFLMFAAWKLVKRTKATPYEDMDFDSGRWVQEEEEKPQGTGYLARLKRAFFWFI
ncbi:hypothetical protein BZG36_02109 [Bifiguratus adelaidae]|uniref:Amino acid permease/ SLC12A domain-containing protein n=1 Tax=Bifiguratus adelaidae TaxID=1938954 RepID=A0A261Y373_9FUNG|nr:hypothetical protein BZG36_02109 [Bifiguratus adelaidae]